MLTEATVRVSSGVVDHNEDLPIILEGSCGKVDDEVFGRNQLNVMSCRDQLGCQGGRRHLL